MANKEYKVRGYADDMVCFMVDPDLQIDKWNEFLNDYGEVSGFQINRDKTKVIHKNRLRKKIDNLAIKTGYEIEGGVKYLRIWLSNNNRKLYRIYSNISRIFLYFLRA